MERIDLDLGLVDTCVDKSLELLQRTFRSNDDGTGGWYHQLDNPAPGPSATGVGLSSFLLHGRRLATLQHCLAFLERRQIRSDEPLLDGGWAVNTSLGRPVAEVTALISRLLVISRLAHTAGAPDVGRAAAWLSANQNDDGGWGSLKGQESRTWLTAMAVRAQAVLDPTGTSLRKGAGWLVSSRHPRASGWGELPSHPVTVTHSAYALTALVDSGLARHDHSIAEAINAGYSWLTSNFDPDVLHDEQARIENYNVTARLDDGADHTWHNSVWHPGLPYVVSALLRQPEPDRFDLLVSALRTLLTAQLDDGRWPPIDSAATQSMWSVWPFLEALSDLKRHGIHRGNDRLTCAGRHILLGQRGAGRALPLGRVRRSLRNRSPRELVRRFWSAGFAVVFVIGGAVLAMSTPLTWREFGIGMLIPIALFGVQQVSRTRAGSPGQRR